MKKLLLIALAIMIILGCLLIIHSKDDNLVEVGGLYYETIVIDSCQYISSSGRIAHKGNCKYCQERRKQEMRELIKEFSELKNK